MPTATIARVRSFAFSGIEAVPVEVQVQISTGSPALLLVGLPDKAVGEARDAKRMTPKGRERLCGVIRSQALCVSVAWAQPSVIDEVNILRATLLAMGRACRRAASKAGGNSFLVLVDGPRRLGPPGHASVYFSDPFGNTLELVTTGYQGSVVEGPPDVSVLGWSK